MRTRKQIEQRLQQISEEDWYGGNEEIPKLPLEWRRYWEGYRNGLMFAIQATEKTKLPWEK